MIKIIFFVLKILCLSFWWLKLVFMLIPPVFPLPKSIETLLDVEMINEILLQIELK